MVIEIILLSEWKYRSIDYFAADNIHEEVFSILIESCRNAVLKKKCSAGNILMFVFTSPCLIFDFVLFCFHVYY